MIPAIKTNTIKLGKFILSSRLMTQLCVVVIKWMIAQNRYDMLVTALELRDFASLFKGCDLNI